MAKSRVQPAGNRNRAGRFVKGTSGNPTGRRGRKRSRSDGWENILTKVGTTSDKRSGARFTLKRMSDRQAHDLWRGNDIAARIVETIPKEAFRRKFCIKIGIDPDTVDNPETPVDETADEVATVKETVEAVDAALEDLKVRATFVRAGSLERGLGGAAIFPVINDGTEDLSKPLNEKGIIRIERLQVFEPRELIPLTYYSEITDPKFRQPETYQLRPISPSRATKPLKSNVVIHESRLIVFPGLQHSADDVGMSTGWGDSVLQRVDDVLADYELGLSNGAALLGDFAQGVLKIGSLDEMIAHGDEEVIKYLNTIMMAKSVIRNLVLSANDEYTRVDTPMTGLPEMIDRLERRLTAAADMPATYVFGMSPGGLNATGESDRIALYDRVAAIQETNYLDRVERLVYLVLIAKEGPTKGVVPATWSAEFQPLLQPSKKEDLDTRNVQSQIDERYFNMGVLDAPTIADNRFGGDDFSYETHVEEPEDDLIDPASPEAQAIRDPGGAAAATGNVQELALNGSQISAMVEVATAIASKQIPREAGIAILSFGLKVPDAEAARMAGPEDFAPVVKPAPAPFGNPAPAPVPQADQADRIEKRGKSWVVLNAAGTEVLGTFTSEAAARERLRQIEAAKAKTGGGY